MDQEFRQGTNCSAPGCQTSQLGDSGWRLESPEGLFSHMSSGWYWLLTWGFSSSPYGPHQMVSPHRLGWTSSQHGAWVPNTTILREIAFYNLALEVTQCHFNCIVFKLVTKPWPVSREKKWSSPLNEEWKGSGRGCGTEILQWPFLEITIFHNYKLWSSWNGKDHHMLATSGLTAN